MKTLADRINDRMTDLGIKQDDLAKQIKISQAAVQKITSGKTVNPRKLLEIARVLRVSPEWLATGEAETPHQLSVIAGGGLEASTARELETPRPPVIEETDWKALSPKVRALVEDFVIKSSSGKLSDSNVSAIQNMVDELSKD